MCEGYYDTTRQGLEKPFVEGSVNITPITNRFHGTEFILDTGANRTCLSQATAGKIGIDDGSWYDDVIDITTAGGQTEAKVFRGDINLAFRETSGTLYMRHVEPLDEIFIVPALTDDILGRDVLDRFDLEFSYAEDRVVMTRDDFGSRDGYEVVPVP